MLCTPRPPSICIVIGKRGRRPFSITGIAVQQTTPPPSLYLFVVEDGRRVGIVSLVPARKYIKEEIKCSGYVGMIMDMMNRIDRIQIARPILFIL